MVTVGTGSSAARSAGQDIELTDVSSAAEVNRVDLSALTLSGFQASDLGTRREVAAGFELMDRAISHELTTISQSLGQTDTDVLRAGEIFVIEGRLPEGAVHSELFRLAMQRCANAEQTPASRMSALLQVGLEWFDAAKGPAINLANIVGRGGLIIMISKLAQHFATLRIEEAMDGDSPEAWSVAAMATIGPASILIGAIRDECNEAGTFASRFGRGCMLALLLAAYMTARSCKVPGLFPAMAGVTLYTLIRDFLNTCFPMRDNAGPVTASGTGATAIIYGVVQSLLPLAGQFIPPSQDEDYRLLPDLMRAGLDTSGLVLDDVVFMLCRECRLFNPSSFPDPESMQERVALEVRAGARRPTLTHLLNSFFGIAGLRLSAGHVFTLSLGALMTSLDEAGVEDKRFYLSFAILMLAVMVYLPLVLGTLSRPQPAPALPE
ncbi:hypothetical protein [Pseudomonas sp. SDO55104_S430]